MPVAEVVKVTRSPAVTESVTSENALNVNALVAAPFVQSTKVTTLCDSVGKSCQRGSGRNETLAQSAELAHQDPSLSSPTVEGHVAD